MLELVWCGEEPATFPKEDVPNKPSNLLLLYLLQEKTGFKVPDFFVIPATFYRDYIRRHHLEERIKVNSLEELMEIASSEKNLTPNVVPRKIANCFDAFSSDYGEILLPALQRLTGFRKYQEAKKKFEVDYFDFVRARGSRLSSEAYRQLFSKFTKKYSSFKKDVTEMCSLQAQLNKPIYRSGSVLEDAENPCSGVFLSFQAEENDEWNIFLLSRVLSSSYQPYAQFYMELHQIKPVRDISVIVQQYINPKFSGEIQVTAESTVIKYEQGSSGLTNFYVEIKEGKIVRYDGKSRTEARHLNPFSDEEQMEKVELDKMVEPDLVSLSELAIKIGKEIKWNSPCLEFVVDSKGDLYFVQLKSLRPELIERENRYSRSLPKIPTEKIISPCYGFFPGYCRGPLINLTRDNFESLTLSKLKKTDEANPGAVYLIDPFQFFEPVGEKVNMNKLTPQQKEMVFYMNTPRKRGLIIYNTDETWCHMDTIYRQDQVFMCQIDDREHEHPILEIKDGTIINLVGTGRDGFIYWD